MSIIHASLENLLSAVEKLEVASKGVEALKVGQQREMFMEPSNENDVAKADSAIIAQRLDIAIEKVEKILQQEAVSA